MQVDLNEIEFEITVLALERFKSQDNLKKVLAEMALNSLRKAKENVQASLPLGTDEEAAAGPASATVEPLTTDKRKVANKSTG